MRSETLVRKFDVPVSANNVELITNNVISLIESKVDGLGIQSIDELAAFFVKNAHVVIELVDVSPSIPTQDSADCCPHLKNLRFPVLKDSKVKLLLELTFIEHTSIKMFFWVNLVNHVTCTLH